MTQAVFERCADALPAYASSLIYALENAGYSAWAVGGFVRDAALGKPCHDIDLATSAHWSQVKEMCRHAGFRTVETGIDHGTITVLIDRPGVRGTDAVEVTTYRCDGEYLDGRRPSSVNFVSTIEEDLARRDFTINAMAFHPARGLLDPFDGLKDLEQGVIRCIGDPSKRFKEDALRILRGCRFASTLGFSIDPETYGAMLVCKHLLAKVSTERITHELDEMLLGRHVHDALMGTVDVISFALPELCAMKGCAQNTRYHIYDVLEHTAWAVQFAPQTRLLRWAALCHDMGKPAAAFAKADGISHFYGHAKVSATLSMGLAERMLMSNAFKTDLRELVLRHDDAIEATPKSVKRHLAQLGGRVDLFRDLCDLKRADTLAHASFCHARLDEIDAIEGVLDDVLAANEAFSLKGLAIKGDDVIACGVPAGPQVGQILQNLLAGVINEELPNERTALLDAVRARARR